MLLKLYEQGQEFAKENEEFLDRHFPETCFMVENASSLRTLSDGYSIRITSESKGVLLAQRKYPYNLTLSGSVELVSDLYRYLKKERPGTTGVLGESTLVAELTKLCYEVAVKEHLQYMEAVEGSVGDLSGVEIATSEDVGQLVELDQVFRTECNTYPVHEKKFLQERISRCYSDYAVCRVDGEIVAQARITRDYKEHLCISGAVTKQEYRNRGYMRKVISFLTAIAWSRNQTPYLFVNEANPISNHLYSSIGYSYGTHFTEAEIIM